MGAEDEVFQPQMDADSRRWKSKEKSSKLLGLLGSARNKGSVFSYLRPFASICGSIFQM
jgi:hypothetical protein